MKREGLPNPAQKGSFFPASTHTTPAAPVVYRPHGAMAAQLSGPPVYRPYAAQSKPLAVGSILPPRINSAPPVYRPNVSQTRPSAGGMAPPVYRPQQPLQLKRPPTSGPPVYRPAMSPVLGTRLTPQPKLSGGPRLPVYRPNSIQMVKVKLPARVQLTGGAGVSVVWKKKKNQDLPHVSVVHKAPDKSGNIEVTNFHYKFAHAGYYNWDDTDGTTTFKFRGGEPTSGVYIQTQKAASKFGITLEKPASVQAEEAAAKAAKEAAAAQKAAEEAAAKKAAEEAAALEEAEARRSATPKVAAVVAAEEPPASWEDAL